MGRAGGGTEGQSLASPAAVAASASAASAAAAAAAAGASQCLATAGVAALLLLLLLLLVDVLSRGRVYGPTALTTERGAAGNPALLLSSKAREKH